MSMLVSSISAKQNNNGDKDLPSNIPYLITSFLVLMCPSVCYSQISVFHSFINTSTNHLTVGDMQYNSKAVTTQV